MRWFTDNQNVVRILQVGSRLDSLQEQALLVFNLARENNIRIEPEWIPRQENQKADYISRIIDPDDWMLRRDLFLYIDNIWGPHTVDRFASEHNAQLPKFNSRFWNPGSEAIDSFTVNWYGENNWWCPPLYLVLRLLYHAKTCKAVGTLIVPE